LAAHPCKGSNSLVGTLIMAAAESSHMIPPFASRFLAGETPSAAIDHARDLNEKDIGALLNLLGEHYDDRTAVAADTRSYRSLIADIGEADIEACVSVKPTQLGLDISEDCFREHLDLVLEAASEHDVFVWVDMEDHSTTAATVEAFAENAEEHDMGICIQSNLRRTRDDLEGLADLPGKVRLVKGAYNPPGAVAFESKDRIDEEMERNLRFMFEEFEDGIALGSHDPELVTLAADLHAKHRTRFRC
jgi:proline dehydrogenase